jgi:hypothetical protein
VAELRKRGDSFWDEFEFYLSDLMVGLVLDVVLVTLIAPVAVLGRPGGAGEWAGEWRKGRKHGGQGLCPASAAAAAAPAKSAADALHLRCDK